MHANGVLKYRVVVAIPVKNAAATGLKFTSHQWPIVIEIPAYSYVVTRYRHAP